MITNEPSDTSNDMERYKNANTVCELLSFDNITFVDIIVNNDKYMSQLWSFVAIEPSKESEDDQPDSSTLSLPPLNPLLASFFTKVFLHLFTHKIEPVIDFLARQETPNDLVSVILRHINTSAIMDLVYKSWEYVNMDKKNGQENCAKFNQVSVNFEFAEPFSSSFFVSLQLLLKNGFIEKMIDIFGDEDADLKQQNAAQLVSDLVKTARDLLSHMTMNGEGGKDQVDAELEMFEQTEVLRRLLRNMFKTRTKNSISSGLKIIQDLLVYRIQL